MSDALNFLVKARPEALGHYFAFLKDAGSQLDPKTRNLISVITKVDVQTERGLRQYLRRALREGCSAAEVLDALLMAFPTLGLAKIVWAVDIILAMDLPEFAALAGAAAAPAPVAPAGEPRWHDLMASAEVAQGTVLRVECDGLAVLVYREKRKTQVYDSRCPHQATHIPPLNVQGTTLVCSKHRWEFDVRSGACTKVGDTPLTQYESKVVKGRLMAFW